MNNFYQRQIILPFIGISGQEKLSNASVLIIGAGGLGHPCALYLTGSGIGTLGILDFDKVDFSNLHRQIAFTPEDIGEKKAQVLANKLSKQNPIIKIIAHDEYLDSCNIQKIFSDYQIIIDCSDNLHTKFLVHDYCYHSKKILIQGSIDQIEGELKVFDFQNYGTQENAPCLRCLWVEIPKNNCVESCRDAGVLPTTAGVFGTLIANETLKIILQTDHLINGESFLFNLRSLQSRKIKWKKNIACPLCNSKEISTNTLHPCELSHHHIANLTDFQIIDLRTPMPASSEINPELQYLLVCEQGHTSLSYAKIMRKEGLLNVWSLQGGVKCLSLIK